MSDNDPLNRSNALRSDAQTPHVWLWDELARRLGSDAAMDLYEAYTARNRQYNRDRWATVATQAKPAQRRTKIKQRITENEQ